MSCLNVAQMEKDVYLEAKKDIVLGNGTALLLGYGEYRTDNGLAKRKKNTAKLFPFNMVDVNYAAHFDTKIQSLKDYLGAFQSNKELVSPFVAAHKITYGDDKEPRLKTQSFFAFELKSLAQNMQVSQQNGLKVDFEKWSHGCTGNPKDLVTKKLRIWSHYFIYSFFGGVKNVQMSRRCVQDFSDSEPKVRI